MTETKETVPAIYGAIAKVMKDLESIPKNGKMKFGNTQYDYLRADDVQERLNPSLVKHGIVVKSDYTTHRFNQGKGEGVPYVEVHLTLTYIAVKDGSAITVSAVGEAAASDDKSVNKALTQGLKNCHRATFQFASGEPEPDGVKPAEATPPAPAVRQAKKAPAKKPDAPNRDKLQALIDSGDVTREEVNQLVEKVNKETDLNGDAKFQEVLKRLGKK